MMKSFNPTTLLLSVSTLATLLPELLPAMPFAPLEAHGETHVTDSSNHSSDTQPFAFGHQLDIRGIDEQEAIAFANITFYAAKQDEPDENGEEISSCGKDHFAPYVPVMPTDEFAQAVFAHDSADENDEQAEGDSDMRAGALGSQMDACRPYDAREFLKKPLSALAWWKRQKKMDRQAIKKLGPSPLVARFPQAPRFVVYECCGDADGRAPLPTPEDLGGINVLNLAFFTFGGPEGSLAKFYRLSVADRRQWIHSLHVAGISVIMSTFGGDDKTAVSSHFDPIALGRLHGQVARESGFDGVDCDLEDFDATVARSQTFTGWMEAYVKAVREQIPKGRYAFTAAPLAPWFTSNTKRYCSGMYRTIDKNVGYLHDWYNIQYYNQGPSTHDTCADILTKSDDAGFPESSIFEIHEKGGVDLQKLVIGKPVPGEADSGVIPPSRLAKCVEQAKAQGWKAGVMVWQRPKADAEWFKTVRGQAFAAAATMEEAHGRPAS